MIIINIYLIVTNTFGSGFTDISTRTLISIATHFKILYPLLIWVWCHVDLTRFIYSFHHRTNNIPPLSCSNILVSCFHTFVCYLIYPPCCTWSFGSPFDPPLVNITSAIHSMVLFYWTRPNLLCISGCCCSRM